MSTASVPWPASSSGASRRVAKAGTLRTLIRSAFPSRQVATISTGPAGGSRTKRVSGSRIGMMPVSSATVATQMELEPDIGGVSAGSMMIQPSVAEGCFGGTSRLTWRNTPPRGSLSTKRRSVSSSAMKRACSAIVAPGGGSTPPTMTSPTSPAAWQLTTWITLVLRMLPPYVPPQIVASVQPSSANSAARSGASPTEKNSSSCGGRTLVPASIACAWPR